MLSGSTLLRHLAQFYCAIYTAETKVEELPVQQPDSQPERVIKPFDDLEFL